MSNSPTVSLIAGIDKNFLIGNGDKLPWHIPADLKYFKARTLGKTIVMGKTTFESIGKALPGRSNIVLAHETDYTAPGATIVHSIAEVLARGEKEIMIIGGASVYRAFLPHANRLYLTHIDHTFEGDVFFPKIDFSKWHKISEIKKELGDDTEYPLLFCMYERL
jgi:dihydrofolate reductase